MTHARSLPRRHQALALEPRILLDAAAVATAEAVVAATDTAPGVTATGVEATITIDDNSASQTVDLFSDVSVSTDNSGQELGSLTISVDSSGANQALLIDGSTIALESLASGETANTHYQYSVAVSGDTTTVTLAIDSSENGHTPSAVASLIDSIGYATLDNTVNSGTVSVRLSTLSDEGGDVADLNITSTITIDSDINVAPVLTDDRALEAMESVSFADLGDRVEVVYSSDGSRAYAAGNGVLSVYSVDASGQLALTATLNVDGMGSAREMVASADGGSLYVTDGSSTVYVFDIATDGTLNYVSSVSSGNGEITGGLAISQDGAYVYVGSQYNDVVIFRRDAGTDALTYLGRAPGESNSNSRNGVIATAGEYVYAIYASGPHSVLVYQRGDDGLLSKVASLATNADGYDPVDYSMAVSDDGLSLYVADPVNGTLAIYRFTDSSLWLLETLTLENISSITLSEDGSVLYAATASGGIHVYAVASDGNLSLSSSITTDAGINDIVASDDGLSILASSGDSVTRYTLVQTLDQGDSVAFANGVTLSDSNYDALNSGAGDYNGASITVTASASGGSFGFVDGNGLSLSNGTIVFNGSAIASFTVSDSGVLSVRFTASVSSATANQVVQQLNYGNESATAGQLITLSVVGSDAALSSNALVLTVRINTAPQLDAEAATGYSLDAATSETDYTFTLLSALFADADGDLLSWSVAGLPEGLSFDAATRTISGSATDTGTFAVTVTVTDANGGSASLTLDLVVEQIANRAPELNAEASTTLAPATQASNYSVVLDSSLFSDADSLYGDTLSWSVSGLPEGLSFDAATLALSGSAASMGDYTVVVTVTDQSGASASAELSLRVISTEEAGNHAPDLAADASALAYASGSLGDWGQYGSYVNGLVLSDDGATLVVAGSTNNNANGTHYLSVYSRDTSTGALTLVQVFSQGEQDDPSTTTIELDGLQNVTSVAYSADGGQLFVTGYTSTGSATNHTLTVFDVAADGSLSVLGQSDSLDEKILNLAVDDSSGTLYALSGTTVYAFSVSDAGAFTQIDSDTPSSGFGTAVTMQVVDGTVYVLSGSRLTLFSASADGQLSYVGQMTRDGSTLSYRNADGETINSATIANNAFNGATSLAVSEQGYVYLVTTSGYLTTLHYDGATQELSYVAADDAYVVLGQYPHGVTLSADGSTLYVGGAASSTLAIYQIGDDGLAVLSTTLETGGGSSRIVVSEDGTSIYTGKNLYFGSVVLGTHQAIGVQVDYPELGSISPTSAITMSDTEFDALGSQGNYNGATITLVRAGGADAADTYGFADGNGLTLDNGAILLNGTAIASFVSVDGALTIAFTADVSTAVANHVLQQISYTNTSNDPGSSIALVLSVADEYSPGSINLFLNVSQINNAPSLEATGNDVTYAAGGNPVRLFDQVSISAGETDQAISGLTLSVSGLADDNQEVLVIGGAYVNLTDGNSVTGSVSMEVTDGDGNVGSVSYSVAISVTVTDGVATISVRSDSGLPLEAATALVEGIAYINTATDYSELPSTGERIVTLTAVQDNGGTDNAGTDTTVLAIASTVTVATGNTAPSVTATGADSRHVEGGDGAALFSDVAVSTAESGQAIIGIGLTVAGLADGDDEALVIDGTRIALVESSGTTSSGYNYSVTVSGDTATVTLSSTGIAADDASALLEAITYANASDDPTEGARSITLSAIQDDGGTRNGGSDSAVPGIAASISVIGVNDAPTLAATTAVATYAVSGSSAGLFSGTQLSTVESGQRFDAITVTASGLLNGSSETLVIDGTRIALVQGSGTTANGYDYSVSVDADSGVVSVSITRSGGIDVDSAVALIDGIAYLNQSGTYSAGERTFGLSVQDSGGRANGGGDSASLADNARLTLVENAAPVLGSSPDNEQLDVVASLDTIDGLSDVVASALSHDGNYLYAVSSDGAVAVFGRAAGSGELTWLATLDSGLEAVGDIQVGSDGAQVYVLGSDGDAIAIFSRSSTDGTLALSQTLATENVVAFAVADDGGAIYVVDGNYSGLLVYRRESSSGEYALSQQIAASTSSEPYLFTAIGIELVGDYVYVITNAASTTLADTVIVYQRGSDGSLGAVTYLRDGAVDGAGNSVSLSDPLAIAVSSDGGTLYVASAGGVSIFGFDAGSGTLNYLGSIDGLSNVTTVALAGDDASLYVTSADGSLNRYGVDGASPVLLQTLSADSLAGARDVTVARGGALVVVGSSALVNLQDDVHDSLQLAYAEHGSITLGSQLTLSDLDYDALDDGSGNYNGASLGIIRRDGANSADSFGFVDGNGLSLSDGVISLDGSAIASFASVDGALTVVFSADVSRAVANQVLQQIAYSNGSDDPGSRIALTLTVTDGYAASDSIELVLSVAEVNDAPILTATGSNATYTENDAALALFGDVVVDAVEAGQTITGLTLAVSGVSDGSHETLTVDSTAIALVAGSGTTASGYSYTVSVDGDTVTLLIGSSDGIASDAATGLVAGIAYANASEDPTAGTRSVTLSAIQDSGGTANDGTDTTPLAIAASITVVAANDPPTVIATGADTRYTEDDDAVTLFSGTVIDTVEPDQTITGLTFTISAVSDGANERLSLDGSSIALVAGSGSTASGYAYSISVAGDTVTLVLSSGDGIAADTAARLIDAITYLHSGEDPSAGTRTITLSAISDSGSADASTVSIAARVAVAAVNDAPALSASGLTGTHTENAAATSLFNATAIDAGEASQSIAALSVTVSAVSDGNRESLTIDGTAIALVAGSGTTRSGYHYTVTVEGGTATVMLGSSDGIAADTVASLIDAIAYANTSDDPTVGLRIITLTSIQDDGGTENGGTDTTALAITATVEVAGINDAPTISATSATLTYIEDGAAVTVFSGTVIDTVEAGQSIVGLTLTVAGVGDGGNETLSVDGTAIALVAGSGTTGSGYGYTVTVEGSTATVVLHSADGISSATASSLVDGIAYRNASAVPSIGTRSITLTSIQDDGGSGNGGSDTTAIAITASVTIPNTAPVASSADIGLAPATQGEAYHATLSADLFEDADGDTLSWSIGGLPDGLSFDADTLTLSGSTTVAGSHTLTITATDPSGASATRTLTLVVDEAINYLLLDDSGYFGPIAGDNGSHVGDASPLGSATPWGASGAPETVAPAWNPVAPDDATQLLDALLPAPEQARLEEPLAVRFSDGQSTPLVVLASYDATLAASQHAVSGSWRYDPAGNRMVLQLPEGLFATRSVVASLSLRSSDGQPLDGRVRLDLASGSLIAPGARAASMDLQLVLRTVDGRTLVLPVHVEASATSAWQRTQTSPSPASADAHAVIAGKPALGEQLREQAVSDLLAQARDLLEQLTDSDDVPSAPVAESTPPISAAG